ncbi:hypothetical protein ABK040_011390 [Willaertia magna]
MISNKSPQMLIERDLLDEFYSSTYRKVFTTTKKPLYYRKKVCSITLTILEGQAFKKKVSKYEANFNGEMTQSFTISEYLPQDSLTPRFGQHIVRFTNILNLEYGAQIKLLFYNDQEQVGKVLIDLFDKNVINDSNKEKGEVRLVTDVYDYEDNRVGKISVYVQYENLFQKSKK